MIKEFVTQHALGTWWPTIILLASLICFLLVAYWIYSGRKDRFRRESRLPLDDGTIEKSNSEKTDNSNEPHNGERK